MSRAKGWIPDKPDFRDFSFKPPTLMAAQAPAQDKVDLSTLPTEPPIWDQGSLGSCTAHGVAYALLVTQAKQKTKESIMPSRLFQYYNTRVAMGTVRSDSGASIRDAIKTTGREGYTKENYWPYDIRRFAWKPTVRAYADGRQRVSVVYERLQQDAIHIESALAEGFPVVFGFACYDSLNNPEVTKTGKIPMPQPTEHSDGGHCVVLVGYDRARRVFKIRNSWSTAWGEKGYGEMPYDYVLNPGLAADFWVIKQVSQP